MKERVFERVKELVIQFKEKFLNASKMTIVRMVKKQISKEFPLTDRELEEVEDYTIEVVNNYY